MLVSITPNAAIDRTLRVAALEPGSFHLVESEHAQAGGKGVNVARLLRAQGRHVHAVVVVGGESGQWILRDLELAGIRTSAVHAPGTSRTCLEIVDRGARATQLHGVGVDGGGAVGDHLVACAAEAARGAAWVALCGSLPRGMAPDVAARIVEAARDAGARVAVDTSGAALRAALEARPDLVRVNRAEGEQAAALLDLASFSVVSDGAQGTTARIRASGTWSIGAPEVAVRNTVGCGDAMLAGLLAALADGASERDALRWGVALAGAQAEADHAGAARPARARELMDLVPLERGFER